MEANQKPGSNPRKSTLCVTTDGAGQVRVSGSSLPWTPPYGLVEITEDGRRREVLPNGAPGKYLD